MITRYEEEAVLLLTLRLKPTGLKVRSPWIAGRKPLSFSYYLRRDAR
jgi:hypothetical protein